MESLPKKYRLQGGEVKYKLLTNKQMAEAFGGYDFRTPDMKQVCKAQAKLSFKQGEAEGIRKVVEWVEEPCFDHNGEQRKEQGWIVKRRECPICWQELEAEVKK